VQEGVLKQELCSDLSRSHDALYLTEASTSIELHPNTHPTYAANLLVQSYFNNKAARQFRCCHGEDADVLSNFHGLSEGQSE